MATIVPIPYATPGWNSQLDANIDAINTDVETRADDSATVHKTGNETISGTKTFSSAPAVPDASWSIAKTNGLQAALDAKGGVGSVNTKTPTSGNVSLTMDDIPDGSTRLGYSTTERAADRDRANHTGSQTSSTIIDFASAARIAGKTGIVAGSGITVTPNVGETVTIAASSAPAGGYSRTTLTYTTASLASLAEEQGNAALGQEYVLSKIQVDKAARVRVYASIAQRTADASRPIGTDPTGDHGVMLDFAFTAAGTQTLSPIVLGVNFETGTSVPIAVQNRDGSTGTVTVTLTYRRTE